MRNINRRKLISLGAQGLGAACLPSWFSQTAAAETDEPHFFLEIFFPGGLDGLYTFDARSLAMTQAGLIANYQSAEPVLLTGKNGNKTLVTKLIDPLKPFLDRFSVLNGVIMDPGFDGHDNNINYLLSGNSFGGESMLPHINQVGSRTPLDYVSTGGVYIGQNISNSSNSASLNPASANGLAKRLSGQFSLDSSSSNMAFMKSRMAANAGGKGRFSAGAKAMGEGLDKAPQLSNSLKMLAASPEGSERTLEIATLIGELFKHNSCKSVQLVIDSSVISGLGFDLNLDTHSADLAKQSVEMIGPCMTALAKIIKYLSNTPYNSKLSLLDVTTVLVGTEFGRSMRSEAKIDVKQAILNLKMK
ncbi:MAG: hypothetical protein NTX25_18195 [Proteobacteria bacterium]|nr:hypothetical protein [Pseudomonadota bacterium]